MTIPTRDFSIRNIAYAVRRMFDLTGDDLVPRRVRTQHVDGREQATVDLATDPYQRGYATGIPWASSSAGVQALNNANGNGVVIASTGDGPDASGFYRGNNSENGQQLLVWLGAWRPSAAGAVTTYDVAFWLQMLPTPVTAPGLIRTVPLGSKALAPNVASTTQASSTLVINDGKPILIPYNARLWAQTSATLGAAEGSVVVEAFGFRMAPGWYPQG